MVLTHLVRFCFAALTILSMAAPSATAADTAKEPIVPRDLEKPQARNRWLYGFDARYTKLRDTNSFLLGAQWNRKFPTDTSVGLALSATPLALRKKKDDVKTQYSTYYGGLNLEQDIFAYGLVQISIAASVGRGIEYITKEAPNQVRHVASAVFLYAEPALYVTFARLWGHETGLMFSYRIINVERGKESTKAGDLAGPAVGIVFRDLR